MRLKQSYSPLETVFDSIEHTFILATLQSFEFGPDFIQWVKTFLCKVESFVMNNASSTGYFHLQRGTHQGESIPTCLFILVLLEAKLTNPFIVEELILIEHWVCTTAMILTWLTIVTSLLLRTWKIV